jgi:hypothetical protein
MEQIFISEEVETGRLIVFFKDRKEGKQLADKFFGQCDGVVPGAQRIVTNRGDHGVASNETGNRVRSELWLEAGEFGLGTPVPIPTQCYCKPLNNNLS